jgi:hypothetical protein
VRRTARLSLVSMVILGCDALDLPRGHGSRTMGGIIIWVYHTWGPDRQAHGASKCDGCFDSVFPRLTRVVEVMELARILLFLLCLIWGIASLMSEA